MASLQTLRNKGGVIVAIVIGIALLAFVLGDMLTSGSTLLGNAQNTVGEINGTKISAQEYSNQINMLTEVQRISTGNQSQTEEQSNIIRNQAWELMVRQYGFAPEVAKIGISVSEKELQSLMGGKNPSPIIVQMFGDRQTGQFDPEYLRSFLANMDQDQTGELQMFWNYLQGEVIDQSLLYKYKALIDKGTYVTSFEAGKITALDQSKYSVRFVASQYLTIPDSTIKVTDAQAREYYAAHKNLYRNTQEGRTIEYAAFEALPSEKDYADASNYMNQLAEDLKATPNVQQFVGLSSQTPVDNRYYKPEELTGEIGEFVKTATPEQVYGPTLSGDKYTLARISDTRMVPDSIDFSHIILMPTARKTADSLMIELAKPKADFAAAAAQFSADPTGAQTGGRIGMIDPQTIDPIFSEKLINGKKDQVVMVETPQSLHIMKINNVVGDSKKIQLGTINYTVEPSEATRNETYAKANSFYTATGGKYNNYLAVSKDQAIATRVATLTPNDPSVQGLPQSRELVRWAFNAAQEDVSKVLDFGDSFIIAVLGRITDAGIAPFDQVKDQVIRSVIQEQKAKMMVEKMAGATSVDALSTQLSLPVIEGNDMTFNSFIVPEVGLDPAFMGGLCGMNPASISKPIVGALAVYAAQISGTTDSPQSVDVIRYRLEAEAEQSAFMTAYQAFIDICKIKDTRYKFY